MVSKRHHPKTIAAVQASESRQWEIGDALLEECGPPSDNGRNDGSRNELREVAEELEELQIEGYSVGYLAELRDIAYKFPRRRRRRSLSWGCHQAADSPEMLDAVVEAAGKRPVTRDYVRAMRNAIAEKQAEDYEKKHPGEGPPLKNEEYELPSQTQINGLNLKVEVMRWGSNLLSVDQVVLDVTEKVEKHLHKLEKMDVEYLVDKALTLAEHSRQLADVARKLQATKRAQLTVVGENV